MSKSSLALNEIGIIETWLLFTGFFTFFWVNGLSQSYLANYNISKNHFFSLTILLSLIFGIASLITYHSLNTVSNNFFSILLFVNIFFVGPSSFLEYELLKSNLPSRSFLISILSFLFSIVLFSVVIFYKASISTILISITSVSILRFAISLTIFKPSFNFAQVITQNKSLLSVSSPLIFAALIGGGAAYLDGFIVLFYFESQDLAIFRYGAREFPIFMVAAASLSSIFIKQIGESNIYDSMEKIKEQSKKYIICLFPLAIVLMWTSPIIFEWVFSTQFIQSAFIFNAYLLTISSRFLFPQSLLIGADKNHNILKFSIFELIVNLVLSLILFQYLGLVGIAIATVVAFMFEKVFLAIRVKKELGISFKSYTPVEYWIVGTVVLYASFALHYFFM
jgi:O-antigen/teichoic acid export membrane protein